jgi:hypothetical protein
MGIYGSFQMPQNSSSACLQVTICLGTSDGDKFDQCSSSNIQMGRCCKEDRSRKLSLKCNVLGATHHPKGCLGGAPTILMYNTVRDTPFGGSTKARLHIRFTMEVSTNDR